jgi:DNA invertase Pin-like site-specific DNA recombinase
MVESQTTPVRYILYSRKSSESDERQAMSIESQINEMTALAKRDNINVIDIVQESKSAKATGQRPEFNQLLQRINNGEAGGILTWAPDRLSRNAGDLGSIVDMMDNGKLKEIRTHGQNFSNNPNEKFLLMILCSQAKLENDNRGKNVKRGLRARCEKGKKPGLPALGYKLYRDPEDYSQDSKIILDPERAPFIKKMFDYVTESNLSGRLVNEYLYDEGFRTRKGKRVTLSMTYRIFKDPFYYGDFEYPAGGGNWYHGNHEPIITKEQWEKANQLLKTFEKSKWGTKVFYFSRLFKCGTCGSGICGEEHINRHGKKYVYYKCTKYGGKGQCQEKYIREENLINEIAELINQHKEKDLKVHKRILREVDKTNNMQRLTFGAKAQEITPQDYIEYILQNGTNIDKKEFLECLEGQLVLIDGKVILKPIR